MRRAVAGCLLGMVLAVLTIGLAGDRSPWSAVPWAEAQDRVGRPDATLPGDVAPSVPTSLTPEELVNIRVYELAL